MERSTLKTRTKKKDAVRNNHLENIIGNLLITEQQALKLRGYLVEALASLPFDTDSEEDLKPSNSSTLAFVHDGKLYKIHLDVEKVKNESMV